MEINLDQDDAGAAAEEIDLAGPQAPGGRILVKLKIPKMEPTAAAVEGGELKNHYCPECDRSFSSGKALGGHMSSAHVQANRDHSLMKLKSKMAKTNRRASGPAAEIVCAECGRNFPSMKALFGHMRCHPERNYRGMINKPTIKLQNRSSQNPNFSPKLGMNQEDDETESGPLDEAAPTNGSYQLLTTWSRTGKRGRAQLVKSPAASVSSTEEEEVFHALIMLHSGEFQASQTNKKESSSTTKKARVSEEEADIIDEDSSKSKTPLMLKNENSSQIGRSNDEICLSAMVELMKGARVTEEGLNQQNSSNPNLNSKFNLGKPNSSPEKYLCNTCNKGFPTYQALGGHKSSHRKFKMSIMNAADELGHGLARILGGQTEGRPDGGEGDQKGHVGKICDKGVGSGRALGGHMSSHFNDHQVMRSSETGSVDKVVMEFDLNKVPEEEDEDF